MKVKAYVKSQIAGTWDLQWHVYGKGRKGHTPGDIYLLGEALAGTQELARSVANLARVATIHGSFPGQKATSGSFGFGIGGAVEIELGLCAEFCVYHLMDLEPGEEISLFPINRIEIAKPKSLTNGSNYELCGDSVSSAIHAAGRVQQFSKPAPLDLSCATTLGDVAQVVRSKNAGPYEITLDVMFDNAASYEVVKASRLLDPDNVASLFDLTAKELIWSGFFDPAMAFKATIPRRRNGKSVASGGYMEDDVHGSQMYLPLLQLELPQDLRDVLGQLFAS